MTPINRKKSKSLSFLLGLVYGYRTAHMDLKTFPMDEFNSDKLEGFTFYYIDRINDQVSKGDPLDNPTHIVALKEDHSQKKVIIYIYKR